MAQHKFLKRLYVQQRLVEVGDDVFEVFDADRETHQAFSDADTLLHLFGHRGVSHNRGKGNERFDAAKTFREGAKFDLIKEALRGFEIAEVKREHGARAALLFAGDVMLRMGVKSGIKNFADFGMGVEVTSDGGALNKINFLSVFGSRKNDAAPSRIAMAVEIFGHGMDHDVRAKSDGA